MLSPLTSLFLSLHFASPGVPLDATDFNSTSDGLYSPLRFLLRPAAVSCWLFWRAERQQNVGFSKIRTRENFRLLRRVNEREIDASGMICKSILYKMYGDTCESGLANTDLICFQRGGVFVVLSPDTIDCTTSHSPSRSTQLRRLVVGAFGVSLWLHVCLVSYKIMLVI